MELNGSLGKMHLGMTCSTHYFTSRGKIIFCPPPHPLFDTDIFIFYLAQLGSYLIRESLRKKLIDTLVFM